MNRILVIVSFVLLMTVAGCSSTTTPLVHKNDTPESSLTFKLWQQLEQAYNQKARASPELNMAVEMLYFLSKGMMIPGHGREVGKEFSMIYTASQHEASPTLGVLLDYGVFANNNYMCQLSIENKRLIRVLGYWQSLPVALETQMWTFSPNVQTTAKALVEFYQLTDSISAGHSFQGAALCSKNKH